MKRITVITAIAAFSAFSAVIAANSLARHKFAVNDGNSMTSVSGRTTLKRAAREATRLRTADSASQPESRRGIA